jgi:hypothetical protein
MYFPSPGLVDTKMYISRPGLVQTQKCTFQVLAWYRHKNVHFKSWLGTDTKMYIDEYYRLKEEVSKLHINTYFVENSRKKVYS